MQSLLLPHGLSVSCPRQGPGCLTVSKELESVISLVFKTYIPFASMVLLNYATSADGFALGSVRGGGPSPSTTGPRPDHQQSQPTFFFFEKTQKDSAQR